jgi:hypothetical protein
VSGQRVVLLCENPRTVLEKSTGKQKRPR